MPKCPPYFEGYSEHNSSLKGRDLPSRPSEDQISDFRLAEEKRLSEEVREGRDGEKPQPLAQPNPTAPPTPEFVPRDGVRETIKREFGSQYLSGPDRSARPSLSEMKAKYGENWGLGGEGRG